MMRRFMTRLAVPVLLLLAAVPGTAAADITQDDLEQAREKVREVSRRLERWNHLLSETYTERGVPEHFKQALREAAEDIHFRVANMRTSCVMASGKHGGCSSGLVGALRDADETGVVRSPMRILLDRLRGAETNP